MLQNPLPIAVILAVVSSFGFPPGIKAQESESASKVNSASSAAEKIGDAADAKQDSGQPSKPKPVSVSEIEEVLVTADRVEGGGGKRGAGAGRDQLDQSDQTDMDGFFDDIDGLSSLGGDDQGNSFSIDGLSADLGLVTLDGQIFGEGGSNGGFGAGDISPDMILRVDVHAFPTASMEEGGAGGRVNLKMRNPVDIPKPSTSIKARVGHVNHLFSPSTNFFMGRPSASRKFGYMLNVNLSDLDTQLVVNLFQAGPCVNLTAPPPTFRSRSGMMLQKPINVVSWPD